MRFSRMSFSKKIFLAIFGTAVFSAVAICLVLNAALSDHRRREFEDSYIDHMKLLAKTLELMEGSQQRMAMNALLGEMIRHDEDNLSVELYGPGNEKLGAVQREGFVARPNTQSYLGQADGALWEDGNLLVLTSLKDKAGNAYRLLTTISSATLDREMQRIQLTLLITAGVLLVLSLWLSQILTKALLKKIGAIHGLLGEITHTQDYSKRVAVEDEVSRDQVDGLGRNLNQMLETLQNNQSRLMEAERDKARTQVAAQVAHDIRSPLMSMNMALGQMDGAQVEALAILKSAASRIAGIVQKLSASATSQTEEQTTEAPKLTLVEPLIASVYNEHNVRKTAAQNLKLSGLSAKPQIWSVVQVSELQTAISNLINNAFEAGASEVDLILSTEAKDWILDIKDNGKGIPASIIDKIFERSFTFGKRSGSGLGLFQAKTAIEWSGGTLEVQSADGKGTTFRLRIPKEKNPAWMASAIEVAVDQPVFFVDDDQNVLNAWKEKAQALGLQKASFFDSIGDLQKFMGANGWADSAVLVIDQNLNENKKGLEVLSELNMGKRAYLCTSDFDEKIIQDRIRALNGSLIPKPWVSFFELKLRT